MSRFEEHPGAFLHKHLWVLILYLSLQGSTRSAAGEWKELNLTLTLNPKVTSFKLIILLCYYNEYSFILLK